METSTAQQRSETGVSHTESAHGQEDRVEELKERLQELNDRVKAFSRERPAACLVGAMAIGYVVARLARRRS